MSLNPNLASHAPKVSIMMLIDGMAIVSLYIIMGISSTIFNIIPSKHSKDIKKWDC